MTEATELPDPLVTRLRLIQINDGALTAERALEFLRNDFAVYLELGLDVLESAEGDFDDPNDAEVAAALLRELKGLVGACAAAIAGGEVFIARETSRASVGQLARMALCAARRDSIRVGREMRLGRGMGVALVNMIEMPEDPFGPAGEELR